MRHDRSDLLRQHVVAIEKVLGRVGVANRTAIAAEGNLAQDDTGGTERCADIDRREFSQCDRVVSDDNAGPSPDDFSAIG